MREFRSAPGLAVRRDSYRARHRDVLDRSGAVEMPLCFIEPHDAIRVIAESIGREARRQLLGELVRAWVDEIPEEELVSHYAKAVADLDEHDLSMLAAWHASLEVGQPIANRDFLVNVFPSLGDNRREALKIAAGLPRGGGLRGGRRRRAGARHRPAATSRASARWRWRASASTSTSGTASAARTSGPPAKRHPAGRCAGLVLQDNTRTTQRRHGTRARPRRPVPPRDARRVNSNHYTRRSTS